MSPEIQGLVAVALAPSTQLGLPSLEPLARLELCVCCRRGDDLDTRLLRLSLLLVRSDQLETSCTIEFVSVVAEATIWTQGC